MPDREVRSFCRICIAACATRVTVGDDGLIVAIHGDRADPLHRGYACYKGTHAGLLQASGARIQRPQKREPDGSFAAIGAEQALDEIAARLEPIVADHGPDALGLFVGNGAFPNAAVPPMHYAFMSALGSASRFTTATLDVGAIFIAFERLGGWAAGKPQLEQCDVGLIFGSNGFVSHQSMGIADNNPARRIKEARARGFKLIVVDPRRTETARQADLFLQPFPGQDAAIIAGMIRLILAKDWHDARFCERHIGADGMRTLASAVEPFEESGVERRAGLQPGQLRAAAAMFARDSTKGVTTTMTGLTMAPRSNTSVHMLEVLNAICGYFLREGDIVQATNVLTPARALHAEVIPPRRSWQGQPQSRVRGMGSIVGERNTGTLADEILAPGRGQVRALIVNGGNPVNSVPDQRKIVKALSSLELLVAIDPFWSNTARLAHYVFPAPLQYERSDIPLSHLGGVYTARRWSQYTPQVVERPVGSEIVDDWYVFWALARRLGLPLDYTGSALDMTRPPTNDALLELQLRHSAVTLAQLKAQPGGMIFDPPEPQTVMPARPRADAVFDVMPDDIAAELAEVAAARDRPGAWRSNGETFAFQLVVRRWPFIYNTQGSIHPEMRDRTPRNLLFMHPADLERIGAVAGGAVSLSSDHDAIEVVVAADATMREGVVSLSHGWGDLPDAEGDSNRGVSVNLLISADRDLEELNSMPRMTAIPVNVVPVPRSMPANGGDA